MRNTWKVFASILLALFILAGTLMFITKAEAYNATWFDTTYHFDKAWIYMPDGSVVIGEVESWKDWEDSDAVQVKIKNGGTYYTHLSNVVLMAKKK